MKFSTLKELMRSRFQRPKSEAEYLQILEYLTGEGIAIGNLYQELEMSSGPVSFHRDITYSRQSISLHSHSFYEIMLCRSADRVEYLVGANRYRLMAGDLILVAPGVSHKPILPDDMQYAYERDILWVSADLIERVCEMFPNSPVFEVDHFSLLRTKGTDWSYIGDYFSEGLREFEEGQTGYEESATAFAILILTHICRAASSGEAHHSQAEQPTMLTSFVQYIENHLHEPLTLDSMAAHFYISRSAVSKLFREQMDTSFHRFLTQRRLILAKQLIGEGEGMERVAALCGFSDYSIFYKAFKKEYGLSPRAFSKL
ncbi:MAG: AraC family transcriptional regulator [Clostridia bacterium]|nr:AraC family transcriptional regulator [Clostridia bacterium]